MSPNDPQDVGIILKKFPQSSLTFRRVRTEHTPLRGVETHTESFTPT